MADSKQDQKVQAIAPAPVAQAAAPAKAFQAPARQAPGQAARAAPMKRTVSFDEWWAQTSRSKGLKPAMKEAVMLHMKARGFLSSGKYDDGLKDFGLK